MPVKARCSFGTNEKAKNYNFASTSNLEQSNQGYSLRGKNDKYTKTDINN